MAYTVTKTPTVFGNLGAVVMKVVCDSASATVETGLKRIDGLSVAIGSAASSNFKLYPNSGTAGTSIAGSINFTGMTSGDVVYLTVYGPR